MKKFYLLILISLIFFLSGFSNNRFPLPDFILNIGETIQKSSSIIKIDSSKQVNINKENLRVVFISTNEKNITSSNEKLNTFIILLNELSQKENSYRLLLTSDEKLIGIFPEPPKGVFKERVYYFNLSEYYVSLNTLKSKKWEKWEADIRRINSLNNLVLNYIKQEKFEVYYNLLDKVSYKRKTWTKAEINEIDTQIFLSEIDMLSLKESDLEKITRNIQILFPILPSVYSPSQPTNIKEDQLIATLYFKSLITNNIKNLLEIGTGSGYYLWIANWFAKNNKIKIKLHGIDINPIAVNNAKILSKIGGYKADIIVNDNIANKEGVLAFENKKFDYVIWNMPQIPKNLKDSILINEIATDNSIPFESYWDLGINGVNSLVRLAKNLPSVLNKEGKALIWNAIPDSGIDVVKNTFEFFGLRVNSLNKHYSEVYRETTIIYELSPK